MKPRRAARGREAGRTRRWSTSSNPDNPMGTWWDAPRTCSASSTHCPGNDAAGASTRPIATSAPAIRRLTRSMCRVRTSSAHANIFKGLWPCRHALRLCDRRSRDDPRLRQGAQPLRHEPDERWSPAKPQRSPTRPGSPCSKAQVADGRDRIGSAIAARQRARGASIRARTSSPSIAAATEPSRLEGDAVADRARRVRPQADGARSSTAASA
jgi:hypothetical protein